MGNGCTGTCNPSLDVAHTYLLKLCFTDCIFSAVSIVEFKRAAKRDDIPPFVFEDTDSDIHIHAQLTAQCHLLTKALNSMVVTELVIIMCSLHALVLF